MDIRTNPKVRKHLLKKKKIKHLPTHSCLILTCLCETVEQEQSCSKDGGDCTKEKSDSELLEEARYNEYTHKEIIDLCTWLFNIL